MFNGFENTFNVINSVVIYNAAIEKLKGNTGSQSTGLQNSQSCIRNLV